jgi:RNA binding exosome subunit
VGKGQHVRVFFYRNAQFYAKKLKSCDKPTRLLLFANVVSLPFEFESHEFVLERFSSFVQDNGRLFINLPKQKLILY